MPAGHRADALAGTLRRTAGTAEMQVEGHPTLTLHAGEGFLIPPRTPHNALDLGPETGVRER